MTTQQKWGFGLNYITKQTPKFASYAFRAVLYLAAMVNIVLTTVVEIPPDTREMVGRYSLYAVTLVHAFSKLFGLPVEKPDYPNNARL